MSESKAFQEGYDAYETCASWTDNPYPVNSEENEWLEWDAGWSQAAHEAGGLRRGMKMTEEHTQEWHDGYAAYCIGKGWADNPHAGYREKLVEWDNGWTAARQAEREMLDGE